MHPDALAQLRKLDREDLGVMLRVLHGAKKALKARDECGDPVIIGSRGAIRATHGTFSIFVTCRDSRKRWNNIKRATAEFAICTQDGDDEGVLRLTRLPEGEEIALLRKIVGLRQTQMMPSSAADRFNRPSSGPLGRPGSPIRS